MRCMCEERTDMAKENYIQILTHIRRNRQLTPEKFYDHWENVHGPKVIPWAEKHGIVQYQQIHCAGRMVPSAASSSAPNAVNQSALPSEPIEFDGIAIFLVKSLDSFLEAFKDPYYTHVIEPDEQTLLDKDGPGGGVVASWQGKLVSMTKDGKSVRGEKGDKYRNLFWQWEQKEK
ncbi:hypothetical protein PSPO01_06993 [Paraphaeosphaeria sporulosa]